MSQTRWTSNFDLWLCVKVWQVVFLLPQLVLLLPYTLTCKYLVFFQGHLLHLGSFDLKSATYFGKSISNSITALSYDFVSLEIARPLCHKVGSVELSTWHFSCTSINILEGQNEYFKSCNIRSWIICVKSSINNTRSVNFML